MTGKFDPDEIMAEVISDVHASSESLPPLPCQLPDAPEGKGRSTHTGKLGRKSRNMNAVRNKLGVNSHT